MDNELNQKVIEIWHLAQRGEHNSAKREVVHLLRNQPDCVSAWILLAKLLDTPEGKARCYRRVLEIDAQNGIAAQFFKLSHKDLITEIDTAPTIPELFDTASSSENQPGAELESADEDIDLDDAIEESVNHSDSGANHSDLNAEDGLAAYVVKELGSHVDEDNIIREVSLRGQMDWYEAEKFVRTVKDRHALTIAKRRSPLLLFFAVPTLIVGVTWFVVTGIAIISNGDNTIGLIATLLQSIQHFVGSIAMMLGGSVGIYRLLKSLGKIS